MTPTMAKPSKKRSTLQMPPSLTAKQQGNIAILRLRTKKVLRG
jgi:hypothetical protein